jgi:hypothetical protein
VLCAQSGKEEAVLRAVHSILPKLSIAGVIVALCAPLWAPVHAQDANPVATTGGAEPTIETLLDTSLDGLPTGRSRIAVERWTLRPSRRVLRMPPLGGQVNITVDCGAITATEAGTGHRLAAGEHLAFSGDETVTFEAAGPEEAIAFVVYIIPTFNTVDMEQWDTDPMAHTIDYPINAAHDALPGGSGQILLERMTLPPGSALPPQTVSPLVWYGTGVGRIGVMLEGDRLPFRWDPGEEREFSGGEDLPFLAPGTEMTLRNADDKPVVLYRLTITLSGAAGSAGGTPAP